MPAQLGEAGYHCGIEPSPQRSGANRDGARRFARGAQAQGDELVPRPCYGESMRQRAMRSLAA
jgi:hypothetical protein